MLGKIIIRRMKEGTNVKLRPEQAGLLEGRNTTEQIFVLRIIAQACKWQALLIINFIDFEEAFDLLHKANLWGIVWYLREAN